MDDTSRDQMRHAITNFIKKLDSYPGWRKWRIKKMSYVLAADLRDIICNGEVLDDFYFSDEIEKQHNLIMLYLHLTCSLNSLKDVEYYFRRYPFHDLPVAHNSHITYTCEMYFNRFYEFRERLKKYLNALNDTLGGEGLDVGKFLKTFDKEFDQELRARNGVHHHQAFDDVDIEFLIIAGILPAENGWKREQTTSYRRTTKQWVERVRKRSAMIEVFLEAVADVSIQSVSFLNSSSKTKNAKI